MKEELVSLEVAVLAKARGFKMPTHAYYTNRLMTEEEKDLGYNFEDKLPPYKLTENTIGCSDTYMRYKDLCKYWEFDYNAPTQSHLQKFLREVYDIDVESRGCRIAGDKKTDYYQPHINGALIGKISARYKTYEDALEYALFEGLATSLGE